MCNVLIADDNTTNRFIIKSLLKKTGYNSMEANNGYEALNIIDKYIKS